MNNRKRIVQLIISFIFGIAILILSSSKVNGYSIPNAKATGYGALGRNVGDIKYSDVVSASNSKLYCADHKGNLTNQMVSPYIIVGYMEIDGNTVKYYSNWNKNKSQSVTKENITTAPYIAALFNKKDGWGTGYGSSLASSNGSGASKAQKALWTYWGSFLSEVDPSGGLKTSWCGENPSVDRTTIKNYVEKNNDVNYKAYIYVLYCYSQAHGGSDARWQRLIYAETETEQKPKITIDKTWTNLSDAIGDTSSLKSITVSVRYKDGDNASGKVISNDYENIKINLDSSGHGKKEVIGLPEEGKSLEDYIVIEGGENNINYASVISKYDTATNTIYLQNTVKTVRFKVKKTWSDADTTYRPTSLTFYLVKHIDQYYKNGSDIPVETINYTNPNDFGLITSDDANEQNKADSSKENQYYAIQRYVTADEKFVYEYKLENTTEGWKIKKYQYQLIEQKSMSKDVWEATEEDNKYITFDALADESSDHYKVVESSVGVERYTTMGGETSTTAAVDENTNKDNVNDKINEDILWYSFEVINMYGTSDEIGGGDYEEDENGVVISGYVWLDKFSGKDSIQNGLMDNGENGINGINVTWYDATGKQIATAVTHTYETTDENGKVVKGKDGYYKMTTKAPIHQHPYWIDFIKYTLINLSYVEFEYNGVKYTTTLPTLITDLYNSTGGQRKNELASMAIEGQEQRDILNANFKEVMKGGTSGGVSIDYKVSGINSVEGTANSPLQAVAEGVYYTGNNTMYSALKDAISEKGVKAGFLEFAKKTTKSGLCHKHCYWGFVEMKTLMEGDNSEDGYLLKGKAVDLLAKTLDHKFINIKLSLDNKHRRFIIPNVFAGFTIHIIFGIPIPLPNAWSIVYCNPWQTWQSSNPKDILAVGLSLVLGSHDISTQCKGDSSTKDIVKWEIPNVNCGLIEREQPDLTTESDVSLVEINMNGQDHTYGYANRKATVTPTYVTKFADFVTGFISKGKVTDITSLLKYTNRPDYVREVNPSDVVYSKYYNDQTKQFSEDFKVYVTYSTTVYNQSSTLPAKVNSIINYFDNRYQEVVEVSASANKSSGLVPVDASVGSTGTVSSKYPDSDVFGSVIVNLNEDAWIKPALEINDTNADFSDFVTINVKYLVKPSTVAGELFDEASVNLMHISEIYTYSSRYGLYTIFANGLPADGAGVLETFMKQITGANSDVTNSSTLNSLVSGLTGTIKKVYTTAVQLLVGNLDYYKGNFNGTDAGKEIEDNKNLIGSITSSLAINLISFLSDRSAEDVKAGLEKSVDNMNTTFDVLTSKVRYNGVYQVVYYSGFDKDSEPGDSEDFIKAINLCMSTVKNFDKALTDYIADIWSQIANKGTLEDILKDTKNLEYLAKGDISGLLNNIAGNIAGKVTDALGGVKADAQDLYETMKWGIIKLLEDDTDIAPMMKLKLDSKYKTVSGFVWEDGQTQESKERNEREGDGIYDSNTEKKAANVRVSLYKVDDTTGTLTPAQLYIRKNDKNATITPSAVGGPTSGKVTINSNEIINVFDIISETDKYYVVNASTVTNTDGKYAFTGLIEDEYQVEFQYDKNATVVGTNHELDGRNYKSTIIKNEMVKQLFTEELDYSSNTDWHIQLAEAGVKNTSVAADDMQLRCQYEKDLVNGNYYSEVTMAARTNKFKLQVEYVTTDKKSTKVNNEGNPEAGGTFDKDLMDVFNFGVVTRAKEDLSVDKTIENLTLTLANGQVLVDGNPYGNDTLNYTVALGSKDTTKVRGSNYAGRRVRTEVDTELLHGATLDIVYKITVRNDSEIDYKYDTDVQEGENIYTHNKYYYFGNRSDLDKPGHEIIDSTILEVIDYLDSDLTIVDDVDTLTGDWKIVSNIEDLKGTDNNGQLVSVGQNSVYEDLEKNRDKYTILKTEIFKDLKASLKEEERSREVKLHVSKLLGNQSEQYNYANGIEIVKIGGKIARSRIAKHDENYAPKYIPGNFVPSKNVGDEQDSDKIDYIITPPTGTQETLVYIIIAVVGLIIVSVGVVLIKKFVIKK